MTIIELNGLEFSGAASSVPGFYFRKLKDWYSITDSKSEIRERAQADGAALVDRDWRSSSTPSFEAFYLGATVAETLMALRQFHRAVGSNRPSLMTVTDELGPTSRTVSVRSAPVPDMIGQPYFSVPIDMVGDAHRLGPAVQAGPVGLPVAGGGLVWPITWPPNWGTGGAPSRITTVNDGDETTWSMLQVTGGLEGGFELTETATGRVLRFERVVPEGSTVFMNPRTGRVYIDVPGNDVTTPFLTRREWWSVPAQGFRTIQFTAIGASSGTPTLTAFTSPAY